MANYLANVYAAQQAQKPQGPLPPPPTQGIGYGDLGFQPAISTKGWVPEIGYNINQAAQTIGQGSAGAAQELRQAMEAAFRQRQAAITGARQEETSRLGYDLGAYGGSPDLLRRRQFALGAQDQRSIGEARAGSEAALHQALAELTKGTGTELTDLQLYQFAQQMNALLQAKARQAARKAGNNQLAGAIGGLAGSFLGPIGAAAGAQLGGSLFGGGGGNTPGQFAYTYRGG